MSKRVVTEQDFRKPEYIDAKPEDYEFDGDGVPVRKDRWETTVRYIANRILSPREPFTQDQIREAVDYMFRVVQPIVRKPEEFDPSDYIDANRFDVMLEDGSILRDVRLIHRVGDDGRPELVAIWPAGDAHIPVKAWRFIGDVKPIDAIRLSY